MATIKAIESRSVHQIQSGQVIVDLVSVVKELVENSLDAGATSIDVRFKNHGLDSMEVQDNGKGIAPDDFDTIALKHYTSKLSSYEDLTSLDTFGFRGEALSSLCALSDFHILTARAEDGPVGKRLDFEISGKLKGTSVVAAQKGTTVSVENLFHGLPVRRKELEKNIKREYTKALNQLYAYACISVGVRISVSNQMPKAKKVPAFSTRANPTTKENIVNVFGAKTLLSLVTLDLHLGMEPSKGLSTQSARNWATPTLDCSMQVHVQGHISKPIFGEGRQAPDRQMFFVNSRPCSLPQVAKAFNEVYRSFNVSQTPFVFANLVMDTNAYDVNVSPDKRIIMLHDQSALLESLKTSLTELFEQSDYTVPQSTLPNRKLPQFKPLTVAHRSNSLDSRDSSQSESGNESDSDGDGVEETPSSRPMHVGDPSGPTHGLIHDWTRQNRIIERRDDQTPRRKLDGFVKASDKLEDALPSRRTVQNLPSGDTKLAQESATEFDEEDGEDREGSDSLETESEEQSGTVTSMAQSEARSKATGLPADRSLPTPKSILQQRVDDFKALVDGRTEDIEYRTPGQGSAALFDGAAEQAIPFTTPSSLKPTPGPIQNAFDRMRPKRPSLQTAEITIGDRTTTAVIGSGPPNKKRRIHQPIGSQTIAQFSGLRTRGLANFAAPGMQVQVKTGCEEDTNATRDPSVSGDDDDEDKSDDGDSTADSNAEHPEEPSGSEHDSAPSGSEDVEDRLPANTADVDDDEDDGEYIDETAKKIREDRKVALLIQEAELAAAQPSEVNIKRASQVLKNTGNRRDATLKLAQYVDISASEIERRVLALQTDTHNAPNTEDQSSPDNVVVKGAIDDSNAENKLSLTVSKADFEQMRIIGQFNLGFILAVRPGVDGGGGDELFIIDQHAADEKYNYERLQRTVTLQSQRLVRPKQLDLTAVEEEIILNNTEALRVNGFEIELAYHQDHDHNDDDNDCNAHQRKHYLLTLPMSREKTFELSDLEELLHLLSESPSTGVGGNILRPKKVQSMLAMRACRSSIMVGKTLTTKQMLRVVRHMGEMEKPWNCPHGRPTMRHLASLEAWKGWVEGDGIEEDGDVDVDIDIEHVGGRDTDWKGFLERSR